MGFWKGILVTLTLGILACSTMAPTPILMGRADKLNTEVNQLYLNCSRGQILYQHWKFVIRFF